MKGLTGNHYFNQTLWGLVLMVEYRVTRMDIDLPNGLSSCEIKWRKATPEDLAHLDVYVYKKGDNPILKA